MVHKQTETIFLTQVMKTILMDQFKPEDAQQFLRQYLLKTEQQSFLAIKYKVLVRIYILTIVLRYERFRLGADAYSMFMYRKLSNTNNQRHSIKQISPFPTKLKTLPVAKWQLQISRFKKDLKEQASL